MGLIALLFSVLVDAIWPLRGRSRNPASGEDEGGWLDGDADDPLDEALDDPLLDDGVVGSATGSATGSTSGSGTSSATNSATVPVAPNPLQRYALRLIGWMSGDVVVSSAGSAERYLSVLGWLVAVGVPVLLVAVAEAILGSIAGFFVFVLHVAVLYLTVELGPFHRRFMELQLLIGAGEERSARSALARWVGSAGIHRDRVAPGTGTAHSAADGVAGGSMPASPGAMPRPVAEPAAAHAILAAYRDVFAPLFWYLVLPGAVGPVLYLFARFAACYSYPLARTAYYGLDWIPLRLASLGFALAGRFEDTVYCLRAVSSIRTPPSPTSDVFLHQRLLLLPVAGGALGLRLMDAATDAQLRRQAPDLDLPGFDPEATSLRQVSGLLVRSSFLWAGLYLLVKLLD